MSKWTETLQVTPPPLLSRLFSVWYRHYRVYTKNLISNGFPPFIEPLFFLAGIGLGLGHYVGLIEGVEYVKFLAAGITIPPAMFTASFECTFGTFIRLEYDKVYDGMLSSSINVKDLIIGEMLFAGSKSFFFSSAVLFVVSLFGLIPSPYALFTPFVGFLTGLMFAALSLFITSFVTNINHFNFYFTGLLTPMFFFSGIVFPLSEMPRGLRIAADFFPLTHAANIARSFCFGNFSLSLYLDLIYIICFIIVLTFFALIRLEKRLIT